MMQNRWPKCQCGNNTQGQIPEEGWTMELIVNQTGFEPIFPSLPSDQVIWVCPACQQKLAKLVGEIEEILGIKNVSIGTGHSGPILLRDHITLGQLLPSS